MDGHELERERALYEDLFDFEKAQANAHNRFLDSEEARSVIERPDGSLRYWTHLYIEAISISIPYLGKPSYQDAILEVCGECGRPELAVQFNAVRNSAWAALVRKSEFSLIRCKNPENLDLSERMEELDIRLLAVGSSIDYAGSQKAKKLIDEALSGHNPDFFDRLAKRMRHKEGDPHLFRREILSFWTHPDFPLWLMRARLAVEILNHFNELFGFGIKVTQKNYEETVRRLRIDDGLETRARAVIKGFKKVERVEAADTVTYGYELIGDFDKLLPTIEVHPF